MTSQILSVDYLSEERGYDNKKRKRTRERRGKYHIRLRTKQDKGTSTQVTDKVCHSCIGPVIAI